MDLHKQREMYMNFGTWNKRSLNWSGTLKALDRELAMFRLDLLGIQEVLLGKGVTEWTEDYMYLVCGKEMRIINYGQDILYIRESYQKLNGLSLLVIGYNIYIVKRPLVWYNFVKVYASAEDKRKDWRSQSLWGIKVGIWSPSNGPYKIMLREFNAVLGENIFIMQHLGMTADM